MNRCSLALGLVFLLLFRPDTADAQAFSRAFETPLSGASAARQLPVHLGLHVGIASPADDYQSNCGHSHFLLGVQARTRGAWFAALSADVYGPGMGSDLGCAFDRRGEGTVTYVSGGLDMGSADRLGAGVGRAVDLGPVALQGTVGAALFRGRPGYDEHTEVTSARILPWIGGVASARLLGVVEIAWEQGWTRLRYREETYAVAQEWGTPSPGATPTTTRDLVRWSDLGALTVGIRW